MGAGRYNPPVETSYGLYAIAGCQLISVIALIVLVAALLRARGPLEELGNQARSTLSGLQRTLAQLEGLVSELRASGLVTKASAAVESVAGGVNKIDPLTADLTRTLTEARSLLDDATQTSQAVRTRVEDFAATQAELQHIARALADVATEIRDQELAGKLANVLNDTSLLAADIGMLTENANSMIEGGKPLVGGISKVVSSARSRAAGLARSVGSVREGIKAGVQAFHEDKP